MKIEQISEQNPQRIANAAISVAETREHFLRERNVGGVIDAARPQPDQIGAVTADEMAGIHRFVIRARFRNLFSIKIDNEPVRDAGFVWGAVIQRDRSEERRVGKEWRWRWAPYQVTK